MVATLHAKEKPPGTEDLGGSWKVVECIINRDISCWLLS